MKAAVQTGDQRIELKRIPDPEPGPGQVLIRVAWSSICGTDLHIFLGEFKDRVAYPRVLGHEFSGTVEALGPGTSGLDVGDRVVADPIIWCNRCPACLSGHLNACQHLKLLGIEYDGAFAEKVVADADKVFRVPPGLGLREASLTELYSLGVHSTRRAAIEPGDRVVVLGAGRLGLSVLELVGQSAAAWVCSVDILDSRLEVAARMGADLTVNSSRTDAVGEIMEATHGLGADRVIECVGSAREVPSGEFPPQQAFRMCRNGGRVVLMGLGGQMSPALWKEVALKELTVVGSRVTLGDFPRALELMAQGRFHPDLLISGEFGLEEAQQAFRLLEDNPENYLKILINNQAG